MRLTLSLLTLGIVLATAVPATAGNAEKLLPEDTLLLFGMENKTESAARLKAHPVYDMWMEEAFQKFIEKPKVKFEEMMAEAEKESGGVNPFDFLDLANGQITLAITGVREVSKGTAFLGAVLLVDYGSNEAKIREKLKIVEPKLFELDTHRRMEEDFRGTTIITYLPKEGDPLAEGQGMDGAIPCWFLDNGLFAISSDPEVLKGILVRRGDAEAGNLAGNPHFKSVMDKVGGMGDFGMFMNLESLWTNVETGMKALGGVGDSAMVMAIMQAMGLREPQAIGVSAKFLPDGTSQAIYIKSPKPRTGIMKFLDGANSGMMPPRFVPPDVTTAVTMALDVQTLWKEARRIMDEVQPGMTAMIDQQLAGLKEQMGVDIEKDFIGSMGKTFTVYQYEPMPADPDAPFPMPKDRMVVAIELSNATKMQQTFETLFALAGGMGMPPVDEEYMGVKIKTMDMAGFSFAVAADHMLMASMKDDMKALIRTLGKEDAKTLVDSEAFALAMEGLPRMRSMVSFTDPRKTMDSIGGQLMMLNMLPGVADWIDFSLWPGETMKKYMNVGGSVMVNEEEGLYMYGFSRMQRPKDAPKGPQDENEKK